MAIDDRDYTREHLKRQLRDEPEQKRIKVMPIIVTVGVLLVLGSAAVWFLRDARNSQPHAESLEGTLRVNINTATLTELESIPGIGQALASLIVAGRPYSSVDELLEVRGIGPKSLESLRPFVKVEGEAESSSL
jgi:competence ComEA-like helix-hairpin-helix protein